MNKMTTKKNNATKLGLFVMAGLGFLILLLYVIGKNQNLFGKTFVLKARFENAHGLMAGNNVRFSGIDAGTVKSVDVLNDTCIEVVLLVKTAMQKFIRKNSVVSIGTDGLVGNKLVNIESGKAPAPFVEEGDVLAGTPAPDTEEMLKVLNGTNNDIAAVASELKATVQRINNSRVIWRLLDDETLPASVRQSLLRIRSSSDYLNRTVQDLYTVVRDVKAGKGSVGQLLRDTAIAANVTGTLQSIRGIGAKADSLALQLSAVIRSVDQEINNGRGTVHTLLKDEATAERLSNTLRNLEQDTKSFNEVMEAIKHSFLFRGYFKKQEKQKKEQPATTSSYSVPLAKDYKHQ